MAWTPPSDAIEVTEDTSSFAAAKTHDGLPSRANNDGSYSTEVSITVTDPRLNGGAPTNIPSLWGGQEVGEEAAVTNAIKSGNKYQPFQTVDQAVAAAKARSNAGGAASNTEWTPPADAVEVNTDNSPQNIKGMKQEAMRSATGATGGARGIVEAGLNLGSGLAGSSVGGLTGLVASVFGGTETGNKVLQSVQQAMTYQPRTQEGQAAAHAMAAPIEWLGEKGASIARGMGPEFGSSEAREAIGGAIPAVAGTLLMGKAPVKSVATSKYSGTGLPSAADVAGMVKGTDTPAKSLMDVERSSRQIEKIQTDAHTVQAAKDMQELGLKGNPAETNPSLGTSMSASSAGGSSVIDAQAAAYNVKVGIPNVARAELGIDLGTVLTKGTFNEVLAKAGIPSRKIATLPRIASDVEAITSLEKVRPVEIVGKEKASVEIDGLLNRVKAEMKEGMTGKKIIESIRQYRKDARTIEKKADLSPLEAAEAKAYKGIANSLEQMVEAHLKKVGETTLLEEFQAGRTLQAKAFVWKDSWNADTGLFDAMAIAKKTAGDSAITGKTAQIGNVANNYPSFMQKSSVSTMQAAADFAKSHFSRMGLAGVSGAAIGGLTFGLPGLTTGAMLGMAAGEALAPLVRSRVLSPKYQQENIVPKNSSLSSPVDFPPVPSTSPQIAPMTIFRELQADIVSGKIPRPKSEAEMRALISMYMERRQGAAQQ